MLPIGQEQARVRYLSTPGSIMGARRLTAHIQRQPTGAPAIAQGSGEAGPQRGEQDVK